MAIDKEAFDLFAFLGQLSKRDQQAYSKLSEEGKKAAHPFVIMRWMSGTNDRAQIIRINEFVNRFAFHKDKDMVFKLLAASATGNVGRYKWIKGPGQVSTKLALEVVKQKYDVSSREAQGYLGLLDTADILEFAEDLGWTKEEIKKLTLELKK